MTLDQILAQLASMNPPNPPYALVEIGHNFVLVRAPATIQAEVGEGQSALGVLGKVMESLVPAHEGAEGAE